LAKREESWKQFIQPRLVYLDEPRFTPKQLKRIKEYYLTGDTPCPEEWDKYSEPDPVPFILRLWLHPDDSIDNWRTIRDSVLNEDTHKSYVEIIVNETSLFLFQSAGNMLATDIQYDAENGFFMGKEGELAKFYINEVGETDRIECNGSSFDKGLELLFIRFHSGALGWLKNTVNLNKVSRFLVDEWIVSFGRRDEFFYVVEQEARRAENYNKVSIKERLLEFFYTVSHYQESSDISLPHYLAVLHYCSNHTSARIEFVDEVNNALDNQPIPDYVKHWWDIAKTSDSIDEALERAEPTLTILIPPEPVREKTLKEKLLEKRMQGKKKRRGRLV